MRTSALVLGAFLIAGVVVVEPSAGTPSDASECTSAFYWEHPDCPVPALVALDDLDAVTGVDTIQPIDEPRFGSIGEVTGWLDADSSLLVVTIDGRTRAYPLPIMVFHEVVNDELAGVPLLVTYCPLCNSGIAFDRRVTRPGDTIETLTFGTSGHLFRSNLVLYDRQHENFWLQLSGTAVAGTPFGDARTTLERIRRA